MQRIILNILFRLSPKNNIMRMACECRKFQTPGRVTESDQAGFDRLCKLRYKAKPDQRISIKLVLYFADSIFGEQYLNSWIKVLHDLKPMLVYIPFVLFLIKRICKYTSDEKKTLQQTLEYLFR